MEKHLVPDDEFIEGVLFYKTYFSYEFTPSMDFYTDLKHHNISSVPDILDKLRTIIPGLGLDCLYYELDGKSVELKGPKVKNFDLEDLKSVTYIRCYCNMDLYYPKGGNLYKHNFERSLVILMDKPFMDFKSQIPHFVLLEFRIKLFTNKICSWGKKVDIEIAAKKNRAIVKDIILKMRSEMSYEVYDRTADFVDRVDATGIPEDAIELFDC